MTSRTDGRAPRALQHVPYAHYTHYARSAQNTAGTYLAPHARRAASGARQQYTAHLAPRMEHARAALPGKVDGAATAATVAAVRTRDTARRAFAAAQPTGREARSRSTAMMAALRGDVSPEEIREAMRRRERRVRAGRLARRLGALGVAAGGAAAVWAWKGRQSNAEWIAEPPPATELDEDAERAEAARAEAAGEM